MIVGDYELSISDEIDDDQKAEIGVYLPFGNYECSFIDRDEALQAVKHLIKIFSMTNDEIMNG